MDRIEIFNQSRPRLFALAYRMVGSAMDAEDLLQETLVRWLAAPNNIQSPPAYLTTVLTRLCIDHLRLARVQREEYLGPWLPEPITITSPPDSSELADSISLAFLVLLETLSPPERAAFLLREVFDYSYKEIAHMIGKNEANCRQIVKRAREHLVARRPQFEASEEEHKRLVAEFAQACFAGNLNGLLALLTNDVTLYPDGGGKVKTALRPIQSANNVARFLLAGMEFFLPEGFTPSWVNINGQPGMIGYVNGQPYVVLAFDISAGHIHTIYMILNPDKLRHIQSKM
ncbi:MAG TPA: RNA polymerase sigma-70 factor [Anaerolineales bacterium]|nr:RNA polymerase sigma-70 factor [Anaerolineales bacterium]